MNWKKHIIIMLGVFIVVGLLFGRGGCPPGPGAGRPGDARVVELHVPGRPAEGLPRSDYSYTIQAEVADTPEKRQKGLSGRSALEPGYGMLYVYEEPSRPDFAWPKGHIKVSAAFLKADGTIAETYTPMLEDTGDRKTAEEPVKFVLEVRAGWFDDRGLKAGDRLVVPADLRGDTGEEPAAEPGTGGSATEPGDEGPSSVPEAVER